MEDKNNLEEIKKAIKKALRISEFSYTNFIFSCFTKWCEIHAKKQGIPLADLVNNEKMQRWYQMQWNYVVESAFYYDTQEYINAKVAAPDRYKDLLDSYPQAIEGYFPGTLLKMIKTPKPKYNGNSREKYKPKD